MSNVIENQEVLDECMKHAIENTTLPLKWVSFGNMTCRLIIVGTNLIPMQAFSLIEGAVVVARTAFLSCLEKFPCLFSSSDLTAKTSLSNEDETPIFSKRDIVKFVQDLENKQVNARIVSLASIALGSYLGRHLSLLYLPTKYQITCMMICDIVGAFIGGILAEKLIAKSM